MRDGNGGWGAQNERGRHGQNVPKQPLRSVMQGSQKGGNDVMRDGNGGWGAQNERGRHGQNIPKTAAPLSYAKVSERRESGVLRPAPIQRRPYSTMNRVEPPPGSCLSAPTLLYS